MKSNLISELITASLLAVASMAKQKIREAVADRDFSAICSASCGANKICEASVNDLL